MCTKPNDLIQTCQEFAEPLLSGDIIYILYFVDEIFRFILNTTNIF